MNSQQFFPQSDDNHLINYSGGNQRKSLSSKAPVWIREDENLLEIWSNEDDIKEEPKEEGFVRYQEYIKGY